MENILEIIKKSNTNTLILDFDNTITTFDSLTSIGCYKCIFDDKYCKKKDKIDKKIANTSNSYMIKKYWYKKIRLLKKYKAYNFIEKISKKFAIRTIFFDIFDYCYSNNIKIIICSSGYKDLIDYILQSNKISNYELIANSLNVKKRNIITPFNKSKFIHGDFINPIVIGDLKEDLNMIRKDKITILISKNNIKNIADYVITRV